MSNPLTQKQRQFVEQYLIDANATQAAIRAGYSPKGANVAAHNLLQLPHVRAAVLRAQDKRAKAVGVEAEAVLREVARIGLADPRRLFDALGKSALPHELGDDIAAAVASIEIEHHAETGKVKTVRYRLFDKNSALEKLMKHMGMFERDNRQRGDPIAELLAFVHERGSRFPTGR